MEDGFLPSNKECQPNVLHHESLLFDICDFMSKPLNRLNSSVTLKTAIRVPSSTIFLQSFRQQTKVFRPRFYQKETKKHNHCKLQYLIPCILCDYVNFFLFIVEHRKYTYNEILNVRVLLLSSSSLIL